MTPAADHACDTSAIGEPMNPSSYNQDSWPSTNSYSQSSYENSPLNECASFSNYMHHGMPVDQLAVMPSSFSHRQAHHMELVTSMTQHQLPMLNTAWPSQLLHHTATDSHSSHQSNIPSVSTPTHSETPRTPGEKPRRTLTFEQKKEMCLYHQQNSKLRQADIGARFGVERSTVSKVLRNKDMFLKGEPDKETNCKRGNSKYPDFDRTLGVYVRRQRERGIDMSDADIMEQAKMYARGSAKRETILSNLTPAWLKKFKQKHFLSTSEPPRRASEPNIPNNIAVSIRFDSVSPSSTSAHTSPLSSSRSDEDLRTRGGYIFPCKPFEPQSEASSSNNASFSPDIISPVQPFSFSTDSHQSAFSLEAEFGQEQEENIEFSTINFDYASQIARESVLIAPRNIPQCKRESSPIAIMSAIPQVEQRQESDASDFGSTIAAIEPQMVPSPQDAQRAATTLLCYLQTADQFCQFENEYSAIMQLTKKLEIQPQQEAYSLLGGLTRIRIPEGDLDYGGRRQQELMTGR